MNTDSETNRSDHRVPGPDDWDSVRIWRKQVRASLLEARTRIRGRQRRHCAQILQRRLSEFLTTLPTGVIGFYWPIKGEFDLRPVIEEQIARGWRAALPTAVFPAEPLEFHEWRPGVRMRSGVWRIPVPAEPNVVVPSVLLVPLVGYDREHFRLGYGGGYYDRTLAAMERTPISIGVGLESFKLETIYPQPHDRPMNWIVTEEASYPSASQGTDAILGIRSSREAGAGGPVR